MCSSVLISLLLVLLLVTSAACAYFYGSVYRDAVGFIVDPVLVAILIAQVITFRDSFVWGWLNVAWVRYLGRISYSIYLYQQIAIGPTKKAFTAYPVAVQLVATIMVVVLTASASYYIVERPFLRLKAHFNRKTAVGGRPGDLRW